MKPDTKQNTTVEPAEVARVHSAEECGAIHSDCPNTWKGTCDRPAGHDGSHQCGTCHSAF